MQFASRLLGIPRFWWVLPKGHRGGRQVLLLLSKGRCVFSDPLKTRESQVFLPGLMLFHCHQSVDKCAIAAAAAAAAAAKSLQSCPTLCDPIDGNPLGSSVPGILQAGILEWVAISFSNA